MTLPSNIYLRIAIDALTTGLAAGLVALQGGATAKTSLTAALVVAVNAVRTRLAPAPEQSPKN